MKTVITYGVEMTTLEDLQFAEYRMKEGIAMNTLNADQRKALTEKWLAKKRKEIIDIQSIVIETLKEFQVYGRVDECAYDDVAAKVEKTIKDKIKRNFQFV